MKNPSINDSLLLVDIIDECIKEYSSEPPPIDKLDASLAKSTEDSEVGIHEISLGENPTN